MPANPHNPPAAIASALNLVDVRVLFYHSAMAEVVDEIRKVKTSTKGFHGDVPVEDVIIEKAEIV